MSSSIPSLQILIAHAQPFRGARDLAFCLKVPLYSLLVWASSGGSGETARMRRLAWTFAARISDKYQIRLTRSRLCTKQSMIKIAFSLMGSSTFKCRGIGSDKRKWATAWQNQQHDCVPSEYPDQPGHPPSRIRVSAVRMKKAGILNTLWAHSEDSDQAVQADLSLRWVPTHFVGFDVWRLKNTTYKHPACIFSHFLYSVTTSNNV